MSDKCEAFEVPTSYCAPIFACAVAVLFGPNEIVRLSRPFFNEKHNNIFREIGLILEKKKKLPCFIIYFNTVIFTFHFDESVLFR